MSGIFIYTASGDSEGTMGGLVRQGHSDSFPGIFKKAMEEAMTCSNDPVCSLSMGQGRDSLNLSACYSCSLIPETSCEEFNIFLDRGTIVGTYENRRMGFYSSQLYRNKYLFTTCRKFKGLEADVVVLVDVDKTTFEQDNVLLFYVGTSRARIKLEITAVLSDDDCKDILLSALNYQGKVRRAKRDLAGALNAIGSLDT